MSVTPSVSDQTNSGSADPGEANANNNANGTPPNDNDAERRLLSDLMKHKTKSRTLEGVVESLKQEIADMKKGNLKEKEDYKALYEAEVEAHKETKRRADGLKTNVSYSEKHRAAYPALKRAGLLDDAEKLISEAELDKLELEVTSSGRFNVIGIDTFVETFKNEYPFAFKTATTPTINSGANSTTLPPNTKITPQMVIAAEGSKDYAKIRAEYLRQQKQ